MKRLSLKANIVETVLLSILSLCSKCLAGSKVMLNINIDADLTTPALIEKYGYSYEPHSVLTKDGFILTIHRIPSGKNNKTGKMRQPILMQHGLLTDSSCFFFNKENSLPFILSEAGYDIWLSNIRGTLYSSDHIEYERNQYEYWDWSWDEVAAYDLSNILKHIAAKTKQTGNILYLGHSMGTTIFFALMASQPQYNQYVKAMFALAPVAYTTHIKGPLKFFAHFSKIVFSMYKSFGIGEIFPYINLFRNFVKHLCSHNITTLICRDLLFLLVGFDNEEISSNKFSVFLGHVPQPTSIRTFIHYGQRDFEYYDFGGKQNLIKYGTENPPKYNISKISVPIAVYIGKNDWLAQQEDVDRFWNQTRRKLTKYVVPFDDFNHLDFLWSKDIMNLLYDKLIYDIQKYS